MTGDVRHLLHEKVGREVHSRIKRGTEWMKEASRTISKCCNVQQVRNCAWQSVDDDRFTKVIVTFGCECREWTEKVVNV